MLDNKIGMPTTPLKTETRGAPPSARAKQEAEVKTALSVVPEKPLSETKPTPQAQKTSQVDAKASNTAPFVLSKVKEQSASCPAGQMPGTNQACPPMQPRSAAGPRSRFSRPSGCTA